MPWFSIIVWIASFLLSSSKEGVSTGKAALIASGAALGAYMLADPSNPTNYLGISQTTAPTSDATLGSTTQSGAQTTPAGVDWNHLADTTIKTAGTVITSPATAATIAAVGATTGSGIFNGMSLTTLLLIGGGAILLMKA